MTQAAYDDEIDLRPLIRSLLKSWHILVIFALIPAVLGLLIGIGALSKYEASAYLLLTRTSAKLSLTTDFPTINEPVDSRARIESINTMAESDSLILQVYDDFKDLPEFAGQDLDAFKERLEITNQGDVIVLTASAKSAEQAAAIANRWAEITVRTLNLAYSGEQPLVSIQTQVEVARQDYETAQLAVEEFVGNNAIDVLNQRINETETLFNSLGNERPRRVNFYTERLQSLKNFIALAESLKAQLESGSQTQAALIGDSLSMLQARASTLSIPASRTMELSLDNLATLLSSSDELAADLNNLLNTARAEELRVQDQIADLEEQIRSGEGSDKLEALAARLRELRAQLEQEKSRQTNLLSQRDLAWEAYQAILKKETEVRNSVQTSALITLASSAIPPADATRRAALTVATAGGAVGLLLGLVWVFRKQIRQFMNAEA